MRIAILSLCAALTGCSYTLQTTTGRDAATEASSADASTDASVVASDVMGVAPTPDVVQMPPPDVALPRPDVMMPVGGDPSTLCSQAEFATSRPCIPTCGSRGEQYCLADPATNALRWSLCMPMGVQTFSCAGEAPLGSPCDPARDSSRVCNRSTSTCVWLQYCELNHTWGTCSVRTEGCASADAGADAMVAPSGDASASTRFGCPCADPASWHSCTTRCGNWSFQYCRDWCAGSVCTPILSESCP